MGISGVEQKNYQNNLSVQNNKNHATHAGTANGAAKTEHAQRLLEAEEMAAFKKEIYAEIDKIPRDRTIANVAIHISEEAFQNMKNDPKYREQIMSVIRRDLTSSVAPAPDCSLILSVGATLKDYRGDSWSVNNDAEFDIRSQNSFYKKTTTKKNVQKQRLREYMEKHAQAKKAQQKLFDEKRRKQEIEKDRLSQLEYHEQQMTKAAGAYEHHFQITDSQKSTYLQKQFN